MFPTAPDSDKALFEHLNLALDLHNNKVTVETAAKDNHGDPYYKYVHSKNAVETETPVAAAPTATAATVPTQKAEIP